MMDRRPLFAPFFLIALLFLVFAGGWHPADAAVPAPTTDGISLAPAPQQGGAWQQLQTTNAPPARRDAALGYDAARHRLILFGGRRNNDSLNDTWVLDLETRAWQLLATPNAPSPRHSMVFGIDATRERFLITTGQSPEGLFNDTWSFDLTTNTWSEVSAQGAVPELRYGSAGGISAGGDALYLSHGFTNEGRFDDTRRFDLATNTWQEVTPAGTRPLPRCLHAATLTTDSDIVLFGGCASGFGPCPLNDTWIFEQSSGTWSELPTPGTLEARLFPALVTLGYHRQVLLFGGEAGASSFGDTWLLDLNSREWSEVPVGASTPQARAGHHLLWVPSLTEAPGGAALLFGGAQGQTELNDLWIFVPESDSEPLPFSISLPIAWRGE